MIILKLIKNVFAHRATKKILAGIGIAVLLLAPLTNIALAEDAKPTVETPTFVGECDGDGALGILCAMSVTSQSLILGVLSVLKSLFGWLLSSMTALTIWAIGDLGIKIATHEAVSVGFRMSLSVANVVFTIGIIMIAFATILRWHEYEAKKLLPKLIITALLVNFSLLAAGLMLDVSNVFTNFFIGQNDVNTINIGRALSPNGFGAPAIYGAVANLDEFRSRYSGAVDERGVFSFLESYSKESIKNNLGYAKWSREDFENKILHNDQALAKALNVNGRFLKTSWYQSAIGQTSALGAKVDISALWSQFLDILPRVIFSVIATFIAMLTMIAMFMMALIRSIWVVVLLIVMPVAWSLRVLPKFENYWEKWWEKFLSWGILYLPTLSFFLYLAVTTAQSTKIKLEEGSANSFGTIPGISESTAGFLGAGTNGSTPLITSFVMMLIVIGIMIAGLRIAQAMGAPVAQSIIGAGKLTKKGIRTAGGLTGAGIGVATGLLSGLRQGYRSYGVGGALLKAVPGAIAGARTGARTGADLPSNLYSAVAERLSVGAAYLSFIPGFGSAGKWLAQSSAAARASVHDEEGAYDGASAARRHALYKSARYKSPAARMAAVEIAEKFDEVGELGDLKDFVDAIIALHPGFERDKIELLKALANGHPTHAEDILGKKFENGQPVNRTKEVAQKLDTGAIQALDDHEYDEIEGHLSREQRLARASKDGKNQNRAIINAVLKLANSINKLPAEMGKNFSEIIKDPAAAAQNGNLITEAGYYLTKISKTKSIRDQLPVEEQEAASYGSAAAHKVIRTKSKSEKAAAGHANASPGELASQWVRFVTGADNARSGGSGHAKPSGGGGHH